MAFGDDISLDLFSFQLQSKKHSKLSLWHSRGVPNFRKEIGNSETTHMGFYHSVVVGATAQMPPQCDIRCRLMLIF